MSDLIKDSILEYEKDIKTGLMQNINGVFIIGRALKRIQEEKKYKTSLGYNTFEEYIEQRVGFSRTTGYRYIEIANKLSENVSTVIQNFSIRKLYAIASAVENEEQAIDFIKEKHIVNNQEKTANDMTTRELEQVVREKKEIKKQLETEQEYSQELQEAIKEKDRQIEELKQIKNAPQIVEKEIIKEVVPSRIQEQIEELEKAKGQLESKLETAEDTIKSIKIDSNIERDRVFDTAKLDMLIFNVQDFLEKNSRFTYLKEDLQNIPTKKKKFVEQSVNSIKEWVMLMEQALDNRQDIVGNIIYGEGEIIDE